MSSGTRVSMSGMSVQRFVVLLEPAPISKVCLICGDEGVSREVKAELNKIADACHQGDEHQRE